MQVLKKFGVFTLICLFCGLNTYAKTNKNSKNKSPKPALTKVVAAKSVKSSTHKKTVVICASDTTPVVEFRKTALQNQIPVAVDPKSSQTAPASTTSYDLLNSRTVTRIIIPKKEETSFTSSVMDWVKDKYSCMIDVLPNQISNVMLYRFIDEWYGVKYRMGGTSKKGVDCSAFVQTLYKYVFGMDLLRTACLQFNSSELIQNPADLKEGDLVFFKVKSSRISHVGVYLRNNFFVHSASSKGVSIANLSSVYWAKYFAGGGRIHQKS